MTRFILSIAAAIRLAGRCLAAPAPAGAASSFGKVGNVSIDAAKSVANPGTVVYTRAHVVTDNGATLDAAELTFYTSREDNTLQKVVAVGNVKGTFLQRLEKRNYTFYSDKAVYDPKKNQVDLTGGVRILVDSPYTKGPLVQTGTTAVVLLGNGPEYPIITTNDVKTVFTLNQ